MKFRCAQVTSGAAVGRLCSVTGIWINKFEIVMRPLRDRQGAQTTVIIETRTAAQASREATARFPEMKVISVTRVTPTVASIKAAQTARLDVAKQPPAEPIEIDAAAAVVPLRRTGSK